MNVLMHPWHDLLGQPESTALYIFFLSVPFLRRPRSHSRLSSVSMNTDIGHRLQPIAFAIRASPSLPPPPLCLSCWCSLLGMQRSGCRGGSKLHWWKVRMHFFFPFVLWAWSSRAARPSECCCHMTPIRVISAGAVREWYANFWDFERQRAQWRLNRKNTSLPW